MSQELLKKSDEVWEEFKFVSNNIDSSQNLEQLKTCKKLIEFFHNKNPHQITYYNHLKGHFYKKLKSFE